MHLVPDNPPPYICALVASSRDWGALLSCMSIHGRRLAWDGGAGPHHAVLLRQLRVREHAAAGQRHAGRPPGY